MYNHIISFMNKNDVDKITRSLDAGDIVISVFLDLKKAFDTVDHHNHILFKKIICLWHSWKSVEMVS